MLVTATISAAILIAGAAVFELAAPGRASGQPSSRPHRIRCANSKVGPLVTASFYSHARRRKVWYTIGYPPGCKRHGLPLVIFLHGHDGDHTENFAGLPLNQAVAMRVHGRRLPSMAMVAVDGGNGYWHRHPGDDPMRMLVHELIPLCRSLGLGRGHKRIAVSGVSMGGYGALLLAEKHPHLVAAVAAISPAVWTSYAAVMLANQTAFASPADFNANDVIARASRLRHVPVFMASGLEDPFHPYIESLVPALPAVAKVHLAPGGHTGEFFQQWGPDALAFLGRHLSHRGG
jgi:enterochelin esterase-like enzyme